MISASFLSIKENLKENIKRLDNTNIDYLHLDIMDGLFVPNKTWDVNEIKELLNGVRKPLDVHLMVNDISKYIDDYKALDPEYITFHYEATSAPLEVIKKIKKTGSKVGISLKPDTKIEVLEPYLDLLDLVLVMSVEPGMGGQTFLNSSIYKVDYLKEQKLKNNYQYMISIDGGINEETISLVNCDIYVVGSAITKQDNYEEVINKLKKL